MSKINYKWLNILIMVGVIYLLFLMKNLWLGAVSKVLSIALPFMVAFAIAYVLYPFLKFMMEKKIPKALGILIIVVLVLLIVGLISYYAVPLFIKQLINLLSSLGKVTTDIATKYGLDLAVINKAIAKYSSLALDYVGTIISNGTIISVLNTSIDFVTKFIIIFIVSIYFLTDMDKIRTRVKKYMLRKILSVITLFQQLIMRYILT